MRTKNLKGNQQTFHFARTVNLFLLGMSLLPSYSNAGNDQTFGKPYDQSHWHAKKKIPYSECHLVTDTGQTDKNMDYSGLVVLLAGGGTRLNEGMAFLNCTTGARKDYPVFIPLKFSNVGFFGLGFEVSGVDTGVIDFQNLDGLKVSDLLGEYTGFEAGVGFYSGRRIEKLYHLSGIQVVMNADVKGILPHASLGVVNFGIENLGFDLYTTGPSKTMDDFTVIRDIQDFEFIEVHKK